MREGERAAVLEALQRPADSAPSQAEFSEAVHRFLGRTNCMLCMVQLDDLLDEHDPVNGPATSTEHPNWRRKYSVGTEDLVRPHPAWRHTDAIKFHLMLAIAATQVLVAMCPLSRPDSSSETRKLEWLHEPADRRVVSQNSPYMRNER
jgi:4-alpha-glucanotransferase